MKAFLIKDNNNSLIAADEDTWNYLYKLKPGTVVKQEITKVRNYKQHKRFFSFLNMTFDMQDFFTEFKAYRYWLVLKCGYFDIIIAPNGSQMFKPKSISFESMDEDEFEKLFSTAIDVFLRELGKGMADEELLQVIGYD